MKQYRITINGNDYSVSVNSLEENRASVTVNGAEYTVDIEGVAVKPKTPKLVQQQTIMSTDYHPATSRTIAAAPSGAASAPESGGASIKSPLPGVILEVYVSAGDTVRRGQKIMVLEAMKMENSIESDVEGKVASVVRGRGDSVLEGDLLITFA